MVAIKLPSFQKANSRRSGGGGGGGIYWNGFVTKKYNIRSNYTMCLSRLKAKDFIGVFLATQDTR